MLWLRQARGRVPGLGQARGRVPGLGQASGLGAAATCDIHDNDIQVIHMKNMYKINRTGWGVQKSFYMLLAKFAFFFQKIHEVK